MWNSRPMTQVYPDQTRWLSSTPQRCQATTHGKRYQYHRLNRLDHRSLQSTLIRMNHKYHMDLDGSSQLFHQVWTNWTCCPIHSIFWQHWRWQTIQKMDMVKTTAHNPLNLRIRHRYRRPQWTAAQLGDGRRLTRRRMIKISTLMISPGGFFFTMKHFPIAATLKAEKKSLGMSFPKTRGVSQHVCENCGQLLLDPKDIPGSSSSNQKNSGLKTFLKVIVDYFFINCL